jgi:formate dehydrogenase major subunit
VRGVFAPAGESKPDWEIFCSVARAMGRARDFDYASAEAVWNEIRTVWPEAAGISYSRLEQGGLQWPCPTEDHPGTRILHRHSFGVGDRAALRYIEYEPTPERVSDEFPFLLTTGRTLYHFNAGTMTLRSPNSILRPRDVLDISPDDAARLGVSDGEQVRLTSRWGATVLAVHLEPSLQRGQLFATFHTAATFLNRVSGPHRDRAVGTPEYKVVAVRIERAAPAC